jgi:hypothetical protein
MCPGGWCHACRSAAFAFHEEERARRAVMPSIIAERLTAPVLGGSGYAVAPIVLANGSTGVGTLGKSETDVWKRIEAAEQRAVRLADEAGDLRNERDELLRDNARLRRRVEKLERR